MYILYIYKYRIDIKIKALHKSVNYSFLKILLQHKLYVPKVQGNS